MSTGRLLAQGSPTAQPAASASAPKTQSVKAGATKKKKAKAKAPADSDASAEGDDFSAGETTSGAGADEAAKANGATPNASAPAANGTAAAPAGSAGVAEDEAGPTGPAIPPNEAQLAEGMTIRAIEVAGNRRVTAEDVRTYLKERVGMSFSAEALTEDVRELYGSGFFDDIEVDLTRKDDGVHLRFLVR